MDTSYLMDHINYARRPKKIKSFDRAVEKERCINFGGKQKWQSQMIIQTNPE